MNALLRRHRRPLLTVLLTAVLPLAQATPGAPELAFFEDLPVVLSASRLPQSFADAPGAVTVLDRETIRASGYRRIPELLRLVPGFNVGWERGWRPATNYHGLSDDFPNRLLVLVDGRPINSEYFSGAADWVSQPLAIEDIERIEVLRGSNSAAYGTNAFFGVVNITTQHASQARGASLTVNQGTHGISDQTVRLGGGTESLDVRLTVSQSSDDGMSKQVDSSRFRFVTLRADLRVTPQDELSFMGGAQHSRAGEGYSFQLLNPTRDRRTDTGFAQVRWSRSFSAENELRVQLYHSRDRYSEAINVGPVTVPPGLTFGPLTLDIRRLAERQSVELQHFFRLTPELRAIWGGEWRRDEEDSEGRYFTRNPVSSRTWRLFGNLEWHPLPVLTFNAGGMLEDVSTTGTDFAPRLFANWQVLPGHVLRAGYSEATRAPTLFESFALSPPTIAPGIPNPSLFRGSANLEREQIRARELGYALSLPRYKLQADVRLYREVLSRLIDFNQLTDAGSRAGLLPFQSISRSFNVEAARTRGLEYQIKAEPLDGTRLALSQAFQRISHPDEELRTSSPRRSTSLMWMQQLPGGFSFSVTQYWVGAMTWLGFGSKVESYRRTDARASWAFRANGLRGELALAGLNLFDRYSDFKDEPDFPSRQNETSSRIFGSLRLEF